jgi:ferrous iron transport protein B
MTTPFASTVVASKESANVYSAQENPLRLIVLAGNPNVGKSALFNALTGQQVQVSNFPGTTVSLTKAELSSGQTLMDTPGVYGLSDFNDEEKVAKSGILQGDVVINVVSALSLQRDLFLTQQLIDWGCRLLVVVNQLDEVAARGQSVDLEWLQKRLGVPVLGCVATEKQGIELILPTLEKASQGHATPDLPANGVDVQALESDPAQRLKLFGLRRHFLNQWVSQALVSTGTAHSADGSTTGVRFSRTLGRWLLHPAVGGLALLGMLLALYQIIGVWVSGDLVDLLEGQILLTYVIPWIQKAVALLVPSSHWIYTLLAGEFGVLTMGIQYLLGVVLPLVLGFYLYLSVLEDCGYLPRLAVLADGLLTRLGLNGRAVIPLILGMGCVTMATISTRVLNSQRERIIANTLLGITIPCSAQLGVIMGLAAMAGGLKAWGLYMVFITGLFIVIGSLLNRILPGKSTSLILDLPPLRLPKPLLIWKKAWVRSWAFLVEAAPLFLLGSLLVSICQITGLLSAIETALEPLTRQWLHLPKEAASAFLMGMVRRDFGLAGFNQLKEALTPVQLMTSLVTISLFVPCIASATVLWKERGWREGLSILIASWLLAFSLGAGVARFLEMIPIL